MKQKSEIQRLSMQTRSEGQQIASAKDVSSPCFHRCITISNTNILYIRNRFDKRKKYMFFFLKESIFIDTKNTEDLSCQIIPKNILQVLFVCLCKQESNRPWLGIYFLHVGVIGSKNCSYLDTTRGRINIFNILISSSPGNWKYFTSCKRGNKTQTKTLLSCHWNC